MLFNGALIMALPIPKAATPAATIHNPAPAATLVRKTPASSMIESPIRTGIRPPMRSETRPA